MIRLMIKTPTLDEKQSRLGMLGSCILEKDHLRYFFEKPPLTKEVTWIRVQT